MKSFFGWWILFSNSYMEHFRGKNCRQKRLSSHPIISGSMLLRWMVHSFHAQQKHQPPELIAPPICALQFSKVVLPRSIVTLATQFSGKIPSSLDLVSSFHHETSGLSKAIFSGYVAKNKNK